MELAVGLDDIATEKALTSGWSIVALPKAQVTQFSADARKLLPKGMTEFHAKEFKHKKADQCQAYKDFLTLIRATAQATPGSVLACSLNDKTWHADLTSFADRLVASVFASVGITDQAIIDGAKVAAPPIFTMQRLLNAPSLPSTAVHLLEIDHSTPTAHFATQTIPVNGGSLPATRLLAMFAESYRKQKFPNSPELDRAAIAIVDSSNSFLVQAADVLGNFSMNYLIRNLAPTTPGRTKKAEIFESVFCDLLPRTPFAKLASLSGTDLELALNHAGALTFEVKHAPHSVAPGTTVKVFQYGSNCSVSEINNASRLRGDAKLIGIAETVDDFELSFDVWSTKRGCAASNIIEKPGSKVWGVLYEVPEYLMSKETASEHSRKSFDEIEGSKYQREKVQVRRPGGEIVEALTYRVIAPQKGLKTALQYVGFIVSGIRENGVTEAYIAKIKDIAARNNPDIADAVKQL